MLPSSTLFVLIRYIFTSKYIPVFIICVCKEWLNQRNDTGQGCRSNGSKRFTQGGKQTNNRMEETTDRIDVSIARSIPTLRVIARVVRLRVSRDRLGHFVQVCVSY